MENIIYNELRSRGCKVDVGMLEQRFVDKDGKWQRKLLLIRGCTSLHFCQQ